MAGEHGVSPRALAVAVVANVIGGSTYVLTKQALTGLTESSLVVVRSVVALLVLVPLARPGLVALLRAGGADRGRLVVMSVLGYALPLVLGSYGLARSTATNGALLIGIEPLCMVLLGALVLGERVTRARALAIGLGTIGATMIVAGGLPFVTVTFVPHLGGDLLLVGAGAAWAIYSIAGKPLLARYDAVAVSAATLAVSLPVVLGAAALELPGATSDPARLLPALGWAALLGLLASALMTVLWNRALGGMDASLLAGFVFLQPVTGVALGTAALGEPVRWSAVAGGGLVLAGVYTLLREGLATARGPGACRSDR